MPQVDDSYVMFKWGMGGFLFKGVGFNMSYLNEICEHHMLMPTTLRQERYRHGRRICHYHCECPPLLRQRLDQCSGAQSADLLFVRILCVAIAVRRLFL